MQFDLMIIFLDMGLSKILIEAMRTASLQYDITGTTFVIVLEVANKLGSLYGKAVSNSSSLGIGQPRIVVAG